MAKKGYKILQEWLSFARKLIFFILSFALAGSRSTQVFASFTFAYLLFPFKELFEKYIFSDWENFGYVSVALAVDTAVGLWKHIKLKTVSKDGFSRFLDKMIIIGATLIIGHATINIPAISHPSTTAIFTWVMYSGLMIWLAISVAENLMIISGGKFPPRWVIDKLKRNYEREAAEE